MRIELTDEQIQRLLTRIEFTDECWLWTGYSKNGRYGWIRINSIQTPVHRLMYEWTTELIPADLQLDHVCRNTFCVNPDHLEPVTCRTNILRGKGVAALNARKETCPHGHPYVQRSNRRQCLECGKLAMRRFRERRRASL